MNRWNPDKLCEFPQWVRNDIPKYASQPGMTATVERAGLAADLLEAVIVVHLGCDVAVCPTKQAMLRVLQDEREANG